MKDVLENGIKVLSYVNVEDFPEVGFGLKQQKFVLGDEGDPNRPLFLVTRFPPHAVLPRHYHQDVFMDAVVEGSSNIAGEWHGAGTVRWFPAKAMYGPVVAGPEGCTLLEFYVNDPGFRTTLDEDALTDDMKAELARLRSRQS
ncbi:MAG: hypothetical protein JO337_08305 [Acidimicrobiales bacterium]|nr:hypothetical protein [Acidimicrobiales bacterium]